MIILIAKCIGQKYDNSLDCGDEHGNTVTDLMRLSYGQILAYTMNDYLKRPKTRVFLHCNTFTIRVILVR